MKPMNLIPDEFCLHQVRRKRLRGWIFLWLALTVGLLGWSGFRYIFYLRETSASHYLNRQYLNLQDKLKSFAQSAPALQNPDGGLDLVNTWQSYHNFENLLRYLSQHTPESVYFQELQVTDSAKPSSAGKTATSTTVAQNLAMFNAKPAHPAESGPAAAEKPAATPPPPQKPNNLSLTIKAFAVRHNDAAAFYRVIQLCPYVRQAQLMQTQRQKTAETNVIYFEIQAEIYQPAPAEVQYADSPSTSNL